MNDAQAMWLAGVVLVVVILVFVYAIVIAVRARRANARYRSRHAWAGWDREEIEQELTPWPKSPAGLTGDDDVGLTGDGDSRWWLCECNTCGLFNQPVQSEDTAIERAKAHEKEHPEGLVNIFEVEIHSIATCQQLAARKAKLDE